MQLLKKKKVDLKQYLEEVRAIKTNVSYPIKNNVQKESIQNNKNQSLQTNNLSFQNNSHSYYNNPIGNSYPQYSYHSNQYAQPIYGHNAYPQRDMMYMEPIRPNLVYTQGNYFSQFQSQRYPENIYEPSYVEGTHYSPNYPAYPQKTIQTQPYKKQQYTYETQGTKLKNTNQYQSQPIKYAQTQPYKKKQVNLYGKKLNQQFQGIMEKKLQKQTKIFINQFNQLVQKHQTVIKSIKFDNLSYLMVQLGQFSQENKTKQI